MKSSEILFWNVDTQIDFVLPTGKLYVPGAEMLKLKWQHITDLAEQKNIQVVNTADYHFSNSAELSDTPDFIRTFPPHCMANTQGAEYIIETKPKDSVVLDWQKEMNLSEKALSSRNIVIRKDAFDVFAGNPYTHKIVTEIAPKIVVVYGVTTNVCVNDAVLGLVKRVEKVYVIEDAIKELPNIPMPFENWKKLGVQLILLTELEKLLE